MFWINASGSGEMSRRCISSNPDESRNCEVLLTQSLWILTQYSCAHTQNNRLTQLKSQRKILWSKYHNTVHLSTLRHRETNRKLLFILKTCWVVQVSCFALTSECFKVFKDTSLGTQFQVFWTPLTATLPVLSRSTESLTATCLWVDVKHMVLLRPISPPFSH